MRQLKFTVLVSADLKNRSGSFIMHTFGGYSTYKVLLYCALGGILKVVFTSLFYTSIGDLETRSRSSIFVLDCVLEGMKLFGKYESSVTVSDFRILFPL